MKTKIIVKKIETYVAMQYLGDKNKYDVCEFFKGIKFNANFEKMPTLIVTTDDGYYELNPTDWLIKKPNGDIEYLADSKMPEYFEESEEGDYISRLETKLKESQNLVEVLNQIRDNLQDEVKILKKEYEELKFRMDGLEK